jgi:hypothetical protein
MCTDVHALCTCAYFSWRSRADELDIYFLEAWRNSIDVHQLQKGRLPRHKGQKIPPCVHACALSHTLPNLDFVCVGRCFQYSTLKKVPPCVHDHKIFYLEFRFFLNFNFWMLNMPPDAWKSIFQPLLRCTQNLLLPFPSSCPCLQKKSQIFNICMFGSRLKSYPNLVMIYCAEFAK